MHRHLLDVSDHAEKCTARSCVPACGYQQLTAWLEAPLLAADHREDARMRAAVARLARGQI